MKLIGYDEPTHFAERVERGAHVLAWRAGAVNPKGTIRESNHRRSRAQANPPEPHWLLSDPDGSWHDLF